MKPALPKSQPRAPAPLLDVHDVADRLGVSLKTVRRMIARGELRVHRIGRLIRIAEADIQSFINTRRF